MPDERVDVLIVGSGLCGLAIAVMAARNLTVRCVGDGRPGASMANFGQLHSGAVYAPVLTELARSCWRHRDRWRDFVRPAQVGESYGLALFDTVEAVDRYRDAWRWIGIDVKEIDPRATKPYPPAAAAFRIPDLSVNLSILHAGLVELARASGVPPVQRHDATLDRDPDSMLVSVGPSAPRADLVVLATGAATPNLLDRAGIEHPLRTRRIAWGRCTGSSVTHLTYWLDCDLLAISPDRDGVRVGLPGVDGEYGTTEAECGRLRAALDLRGICPPDCDLSLLWGTVCETSNLHANPSNLVVDLRDPPAGWSPAKNLIIALPGKWTTAWHCADQVVDAIR